MRARLAFAAGAVALVATYAVAASRTATPTFSPTGGTYNTAQSVTLSDTTPGAKIYYTTDGSTPTTASPLYSAPIAVSATKTVKAIAAAAGYSSSSVASATYTLLAANPALSPAAGTYNATQTVSMTDATPGASMCRAPPDERLIRPRIT
jgi:hypothetical protein